MDGVEKELQTLRETYNTKQDEWIKEKLATQVNIECITSTIPAKFNFRRNWRSSKANQGMVVNPI